MLALNARRDVHNQICETGPRTVNLQQCRATLSRHPDPLPGFTRVITASLLYRAQDTLDEALRDALQRDIDLYAPGINILAIRVTKPTIPDAIKVNYEAIESERTKLAVAIETQKLVEIRPKSSVTLPS